MQACRGVENNTQTLKLTNHTSTKVCPLLFLSSCHEALVKLLAKRQLGCDWALLRFAPREVCRLIKPCRTCHCDYCSWVDRLIVIMGWAMRVQCWIAAGFVMMQTEVLNKWAENPTTRTSNSYILLRNSEIHSWWIIPQIKFTWRKIFSTVA